MRVFGLRELQELFLEFPGQGVRADGSLEQHVDDDAVFVEFAGVDGAGVGAAADFMMAGKWASVTWLAVRRSCTAWPSASKIVISYGAVRPGSVAEMKLPTSPIRWSSGMAPSLTARR